MLPNLPRLSRELMACRVSAEIQPGQVVHLGPGLPGMVPPYVLPARGVVFPFGKRRFGAWAPARPWSR